MTSYDICDPLNYEQLSISIIWADASAVISEIEGFFSGAKYRLSPNVLVRLSDIQGDRPDTFGGQPIRCGIWRIENSPALLFVSNIVDGWQHLVFSLSRRLNCKTHTLTLTRDADYTIFREAIGEEYDIIMYIGASIGEGKTVVTSKTMSVTKKSKPKEFKDEAIRQFQLRSVQLPVRFDPMAVLHIMTTRHLPESEQ